MCMSMRLFSLRSSSHPFPFSTPPLCFFFKLSTNMLIFPQNSGSDTHALTLFNVTGTTINTIRPYSPLLTTAKSSPIACAAFHPHQMQLAVGSMGHGNVEVFTCVGRGGEEGWRGG